MSDQINAGAERSMTSLSEEAHHDAMEIVHNLSLDGSPEGD